MALEPQNPSKKFIVQSRHDVPEPEIKEAMHIDQHEQQMATQSMGTPVWIDIDETHDDCGTSYRRVIERKATELNSREAKERVFFHPFRIRALAAQYLHNSSDDGEKLKLLEEGRLKAKAHEDLSLEEKEDSRDNLETIEKSSFDSAESRSCKTGLRYGLSSFCFAAKNLILQFWFFDYNIISVNPHSFQQRLFNMLFVSALMIVLGNSIRFEVLNISADLDDLNRTMEFLFENFEQFPVYILPDPITDESKIIAARDTGNYLQWDGKDILSFAEVRLKRIAAITSRQFLISFGIFFGLLIAFHFMNRNNAASFQLWFRLNFWIYYLGLFYQIQGWVNVSRIYFGTTIVNGDLEAMTEDRKLIFPQLALSVAGLVFASLCSWIINCLYPDHKLEYYLNDRRI